MQVLPLKTVSLANVREHWTKRSKRAKAHRTTAKTLCRPVATAIGLPVVVTLTRVAPSNGLDDDNLRPALKSVRDGIADAFGLDDRDPRIEWRYGQRKGPYSVIVEIEKC